MSREDTGDLPALAEADPVSRLGPPGFDPGRVRLDSCDRQFEGVAKRWRQQYFRNGRWGSTISGPADATYAKIRECKTVADLDALGLKNWVSETCDLCGSEPNVWLEIGDEPDYEARWLTICLPCAEHLGAIATETRRAETTQIDSVEDEGAVRSNRPTSSGNNQ
jgi:hypothetical protein